MRIRILIPVVHAAWLCCAFAPLVSARIGEDETTVGVRYGKPVDTVPTTDPHIKARVYSAAGLKVTVFFVDGVSGGEQYEKSDLGNALSEVEITALLKANSNGGVWNEDHSGSDGRLWLLNGTHVFATYINYQARKLLIISTIETASKAKEVMAAAQQNSLQNF